MIRRENPGENLHSGHRERMRKKFSAYGQRVFENYELLEMLLFSVVKYKDTNPIAKRLLLRFSTLKGVLEASSSELCEIEGVGERVADFLVSVGKIGGILGTRYASTDILECNTYDSAGQVVCDHFRGSSGYVVSMVMLDNMLRVLGIKDICYTDYESAAVRPKNFIDEAIRSRAAAVILAHTHPYGPLLPSPGDIETNRLLVNALSHAGIFCLEHYIVSGDRYVGMMNNGPKAFFQIPALRDFLRKNFGVASFVSLDKAEEEKEIVYDNAGLVSAFGKVISFIAGAEESERIAKGLLNRYSNLPNVMSASALELFAVPGVNESLASFIKVLAAILSRSVTELFKIGAVNEETNIRKYFKALFLGLSVESIYMMTFDKNGATRGVYFLSEGTLNSAGISPRKVLELAVADCAASVVIAHNHPTGYAHSSDEDYQTTAQIANALNLAGVQLTAHYVIAGDDCEILKLRFDRSDHI